MAQPSAEIPPRRERAFNLPPVILALLAVILGIEAVQAFLLNDEARAFVLANFAFVPNRGALESLLAGEVTVLPGAGVWSYVTYALLHADWMHAGLNAIWLAAFGSPVALRFGTMRFLALSGIAAIVGAGVYMIFRGSDVVPMVGASAAISAYFAAASRFLFLGPAARLPVTLRHLAPAATLQQMFTSRTTLIFMAVWFVLNIGVGVFGIGAGGVTEAWEAHLGGFAVGLFLFTWFDPMGRLPDRDIRERAGPR